MTMQRPEVCDSQTGPSVYKSSGSRSLVVCIVMFGDRHNQGLSGRNKGLQTPLAPTPVMTLGPLVPKTTFW